MIEPQDTDAGPRREKFEVLIAGGGVAGLEAAFALRDLAGDHVSLSILAPTDEFVYRPMSVAEPFTSGYAQHYRLAELTDAADATLVQDALVRVDVADRQVLTAHGAELPYDALMICVGATAHKRYEHVTTVDDAQMNDLLHGLVQDIEGGYIHRLAFVVPSPMPWPLPVYELALMASERAWERQIQLSITVLTPEETPLAIFGPEVSRELSRLLADQRIEVITSVQCDVPDAKTVRMHPGDRTLAVDHIVALPELRGPGINGLPCDDSGFVPVDQFTAVTGVKHVWAAGDATNFPVKHGGVSAQMAVAAANGIAAVIGWSVPHRFVPVLEGVLLTGGNPRQLRGPSDRGGPPEMLELKRNDQNPKIAARYLASHLASLTPVTPAPRQPTAPVTAPS